MRLCQNVGASVDGLTHTVEHAAQHILGNRQFQGVSQETDLGLCQVDALCGLKQLHNSTVSVHFQHFAAAFFTAGQFDLSQLVEGDAFYAFHDHQRAGDLFDCFIFFDHSSFPPSMTAWICAFISVSIWAYSASNFSGAVILA